MLYVADIFEKIATETATLARYNKKPTVTSREIQTAGTSQICQVAQLYDNGAMQIAFSCCCFSSA